jgi:uncharacterized NAD-dependent epimerase/dehydratase family protein
MAIAGWGIAVDAVVSDFIAGAAERLVVEGSSAGARCCSSRPGLATPSVLLGRHTRADHGSAPHGFVLCHKAGQRFVEDERFPIPPLSELVELTRA